VDESTSPITRSAGSIGLDTPGDRAVDLLLLNRFFIA